MTGEAVEQRTIHCIVEVYLGEMTGLGANRNNRDGDTLFVRAEKRLTQVYARLFKDDVTVYGETGSASNDICFKVSDLSVRTDIRLDDTRV